MRVWLPYVRANSGTDVFTNNLAEGLRKKGVEAVVTAFPHHYQYLPWLLFRQPAPANTHIVLANTWNGFAFRRAGSKLVAVEHLFVNDPALRPYKSAMQASFHQSMVRRLESMTHRAADEIIAVSRYTAKAYAEILGTPTPHVISNGIDTDFFCPAADVAGDVENRCFRLLFVGNMSVRKGADLLPEIASQLGSEFEISYTNGLRSKDPFPSLGNVRRLGRLDAMRLRDEYRRADALIHPSRLEGLPLVVMEAMACGTPVVASDTASLPEMISNGRDGLLCRLNDVGDFAEACRHLANQPALHRQMGEAARSTAAASFNLERMTDEYIGLFEQLI